MTPVQHQTITYIRAYRAEHDGISPSYGEIADWLGLKAKSGVYRILRELKARGLLTFAPHRARSIVLTEAPSREIMERWSDDEITRVASELHAIARLRQRRGRQTPCIPAPMAGVSA
ncbi:LexA family protein [Paraburkholderia fungorum]|uniref:LexA family protein n=1 Tax=Paraburkholderia fungorum TaxID=134537 RepID=UPI003D6A37F8